eukprot:PITA_26726
MILLSWNCRGLASKPRKLALKEMVMSSKLDFILLQETLGKSIEAETTLMSLLPGWRFTAMDSVGHSGGLAIGYREGRRDQILLAREEEWRLKSRAVSLKARDENTKFFHNYAKGRKNSNTIWKLKNEEGEEANTFEELSILGRNHFQNLFADQGEITIAEVIRTAQCFPRFVEEEEAESLMNEVTKEEVECFIKSMAKYKSPSSDGWTTELFQHFFDQIGTELTEVVEESRKKGEVYSSFNANFIALIPKKENPGTFEVFRPISLCNCIYKIITKVIAV